MKELSLHVLDITENSINAGASRISINIIENTEEDEIKICITDNGKGIKEELLKDIADPFVTTRKTRNVGLGIPLLKAAAEDTNGSFFIKSKINKGTTLTATFQRSHIDRMPLGDIESTFISLLISFPDINWEFNYSIDNNNFEFYSKTIKDQLKDVPYTDPIVLRYLRSEIVNGIKDIKNTSQNSLHQLI